MSRVKANYDEELIAFIFQLFLMKIAISFISPLIAKSGVVNSGIVTVAVYILMLIHFFAIQHKYQAIMPGDMLLLCSVYVLFGASYILFPETRFYFLSQEMILNYIMFVPISIIGISKIDTWDSFFDIGKRYSYYGVFVAILIFVSGLVGNLNYMEFSYSLLVLGGVVALKAAQDFKLIDIVSFVMYAILIISHGARTPILLLAGLFLAGVFINDKKSKAMIGLAFSLVVFAVSWNVGVLEKLVALFSKGSSSYIIIRFLNGSFFQSNERTLLYDAAREYIFNMGLSVNGLFGDRSLAGTFGQPYVHNIIYELIISFGWIISSCVLLIFVYISVKIIVKADTIKRMVFVYAFVTMFCRYFVSGSCITEWRFYLFLGLMAALERGTKRNLVLGSIYLTNRGLNSEMYYYHED